MKIAIFGAVTISAFQPGGDLDRTTYDCPQYNSTGYCELAPEWPVYIPSFESCRNFVQCSEYGWVKDFKSIFRRRPSRNFQFCLERSLEVFILVDNISAAAQKVSNTTIVTESASGQTHVNVVREVKTKADLHTDHVTHMHLARLILMLDTATDMTSMMKMIDLLDSSKTKTHVSFSTRYVLKCVFQFFLRFES